MWIEIGMRRNLRLVQMSLPTRGVWIEMQQEKILHDLLKSLPTRGVWIEIWKEWLKSVDSNGHSPHGECGLKFGKSGLSLSIAMVTPHTGSVD